MLVVHCEMRQNKDGVFEAVCLENSVSAVGASRKDVRRKLNQALDIYFNDISEELGRLAEEGSLNPSDQKAVDTELRRYMQAVPFYSWRLFKWHVRYAILTAISPSRKEGQQFSSQKAIQVPCPA